MKQRDPNRSSSNAALRPAKRKRRSIADAAKAVVIAMVDWTPYPCPDCGKLLRRRRRKSNGKAFLACPDREHCGHTENDRP